MEVLTTEPGVQLYCGNFLEGDAASGGFHQHEGICLETQALSGFTEPPRVSDHCVAAGADLSANDRPSFRGEIVERNSGYASTLSANCQPLGSTAPFCTMTMPSAIMASGVSGLFSQRGR